MTTNRLALSLCLLMVAPAWADDTPQLPPYQQDFSNPALIVNNDDWSSAPGLFGYLGADLTTATATDPRTVLAPSPGGSDVDVIANQTSFGSSSSGGVWELELPDGVIGLKGSGTADAPHLVLAVNLTGLANARFKARLRDVDATSSNALSPVAIQYRLGNSGNFSNLTGGYFADVTTGPSLLGPDTPVDLPLPPETDGQPRVEIRILTTNAAGTDEMIGIDDLEVTASGGVDLPPQVTATVPANGATGVAPGIALEVQFSEPVSIGSAWYTLVCGIESINASTTALSPSRYRLTPAAPLPNAAACRLTVLAAQVTDLDGALDPMPADVRIDFQTAADLAPEVASTVPVDGATLVAVTANLQIRFSEPVELLGDAFVIACQTSGAHGEAVSGGPTEYTLNPSPDFALDELCQVTVVASAVRDLDGTPTLMSDDYVFNFTTTPGAAGYYSGIDASSGPVLKASLHALIDDHQCFPYSAATTDTWDILEQADQFPGDPTRILDVYRNEAFLKPVPPQTTRPYNREHTWPNSLGFPNDFDGFGRVNCPYTDTHMLYLSDIGYNADRGNSPYGRCSSPGCIERSTQVNAGQGGGSGVYPGNSNWFIAQGANGVFQTWLKRRGDVARAVLYMAVRYEGGMHSNGLIEPQLELTNDRSLITSPPAGIHYLGFLRDLLQWHRKDPPDAIEIARHDVVFGFQGNRNPFVDHPEWVDCVFRNVCGSDPVFLADFDD